jgi:hypothetical protein
MLIRFSIASASQTRVIIDDLILIGNAAESEELANAIRFLPIGRAC